MMTLITGFTCPPTIYFKFITKCDSFVTKMRQVLKSATIITLSATVQRVDFRESHLRNMHCIHDYGLNPMRTPSSCVAMLWVLT